MRLNQLFSFFLFLILLFSSVNAFAQEIKIETLPQINFERQLKVTLNGETANSATKLNYFIQQFNSYPDLSKYIGEHIITIQDPVFGAVPFKLYLPPTYRAKIPAPLILYSLLIAVSRAVKARLGDEIDMCL